MALLDALELERAHVGGNSMGGRAANELGLRAPERVDRLALLAPSLAWLRDRPWAPLLRLVDPRLGAIQPAPRKLVESIVRRAVPGGDGWTAAGVDEFLHAYLTRPGRVACYAAARNIYLEEPHGEKGFWTRLPELQAPALFVWASATSSCRSASRATCARRSRGASTSSSTAATCRSSSARGRATT